MPSTTSSSARPRMSRILGGCTSVSIVRATAGFSRRAGSFGAFFDVHMTISVPFQVNAIGMHAGRAVLGDVGQPGQVAGQQLLAERPVQDLVDRLLLHGRVSFSLCGTSGPGPTRVRAAWAPDVVHPGDGTAAGLST